MFLTIIVNRHCFFFVTLRNQLFNRIAEEDPDSRLSREIDFSQTGESFTPFLGTQIRVDGEGHLHYKYYRKPQKKAITLHSRFHHPYRMKAETAKNFYRSAENSSSSSEYKEESFEIIDDLLKCNGYKNPRSLLEHRPRRSTLDTRSRDSNPVWLKLPYVSEGVSDQVQVFVKNHNLPIKVIFLPGMSLRDVFCSSRPYDRRKCTSNSCNICSRLEEGRDCTTMCPIYEITCNLLF